jgi:hypothetical protein
MAESTNPSAVTTRFTTIDSCVLVPQFLQKTEGARSTKIKGLAFSTLPQLRQDLVGMVINWMSMISTAARGLHSASND